MAHGVSRSINFSQHFFLLLHCVPLYVCRLCINFQELCARLLGMATLRIRFSPSFHALLIDFLSIRKVIIFSAIATDDRHPLRSRSIYYGAYRISLNRSRTLINSRPRIGRLVSVASQSIKSCTSNRARTSAHRSIMTTPPYRRNCQPQQQL